MVCRHWVIVNHDDLDGTFFEKAVDLPDLSFVEATVPPTFGEIIDPSDNPDHPRHARLLQHLIDMCVQVQALQVYVHRSQAFHVTDVLCWRSLGEWMGMPSFLNACKLCGRISASTFVLPRDRDALTDIMRRELRLRLPIIHPMYNSRYCG